MRNKIVLMALSVAMVSALIACKGDNAVNTENVSNDAAIEDSQGTEENVAEGTKVGVTEETEDVQPILISTLTEYDCEYTDNWDYLLSTDTGIVKVLSEGYDGLKGSIEKLNDEQRKESKEIKDKYLDSAREDLADTPLFGGYYHNTPATVQRADNSIVSIIVAQTDFLGGPHDSNFIENYNYNPKDGSFLELRDVVTDYDRLYEKTLELLEKQEYNEFFDDYKQTVKEIFYSEGYYKDSKPVWYMDYEGLTVFFNTYLLGPYSSGPSSVFISFSDNKDLFNSAYIYEGSNLVKCNADTINVAGKQEEISVECVTNEDEFETSIHINVGNKSINQNVYGYYCEYYVVGDGKDSGFVYVQQRVENDYPILYVFKVREDAIVYVGNISNLEFNSYGTQLSDNMLMESKVDFLGTYRGLKTYHLSPSGIPMTDDAEFYIPNARSEYSTLKNIKEFEVFFDDGHSEVMKTETKFYVVATDEKTYAKAELEDGRTCIIKVQKIDYEKLINGTDSEWDVFGEIMYAG